MNSGRILINGPQGVRLNYPIGELVTRWTMHPVRNDRVLCVEIPDLGTRVPRTSMQWTALTLGLVLIPGQTDPRPGSLLAPDRLRTTRRTHVGTDREIPNFKWKCIWQTQPALKLLIEHLWANGLLAALMSIVY